jgi:ferritin
MISKKIESALNEQINAEFFSAYLYLSMSAYFQASNLPGFANWTHIQYQEEISHGMKIFNHINERGGKVVLDTIAKPQSKWTSVIEVFEQVLHHEQKVTKLIHNLVDLAVSEKDHATNNMLQWFVAEQVEEESTASDLLSNLKMIKDSKDSLFFMDKELLKRTFVAA